MQVQTLVFLFALFPLVSVFAAEPRQANVLFIAVDDLNDWVGFLKGHPQTQTPNLDRLAARGIVFTNAHCASPACNPSRAAIFSGKAAWQTGVWSNNTKGLIALNPDIQTLPRCFRDAGYATCGTGKLLHGGGDSRKVVEHYFGVEQRWSPFAREQVRYTKRELPTKGTNDPRHVVELNGERVVLPLNRMPSDRKPDQNDGESFDWGPLNVGDSAMGDTQITDWAVEQWKARSTGKTPVFLGVGYYRPHIPLFAPAKYFERFKIDSASLPPFQNDDLADLSDVGKRWALEAVTAGSHQTVVEHKQWQAAVQAYLACVTYVDGQVGRLLEALDESEQADNTWIVLWSDHGWHLGEKQHWGKWTGWERSTRVPLVIVPPKRLADHFAKAGSRCAAPVSLIDLYPTLVELCELESPAGLAGESLVPLLKDPARKTDRVVVTTFDRGNVTLRDGRWRLIQYADKSVELYDLQNDPNEWRNLADDADYRRHVARLSRAIPDEAKAK